MNILIACEESQAVCIEMRRLGHRAFSCDLIECSGGHPEWHIMGDCLPLLNGDCSFRTMDGVSHEQEGVWDLLIAHPPCTFLSAAGSRHLIRIDEKGKRWINYDRFIHAKAAKQFFIQVLSARAHGVCVENPAPMRVLDFPNYSQIVEPFLFGDPYKKRTCLWLRGLPELVPTNIVEPKFCWTVGGGGKNCRIKIGSDKSRGQKERSKTFPGIAKAMAEQWAGRCVEE